jgi:hypothetical protein
VVLEALVVLAGLVVRVGLVALVGLVVLAGEIECPPYRVEVAATGGNTIPSIAAGLLTKTALLRTGSAEQLVGIPSPEDRPAPGNRSVVKGAIWEAPGGEPVLAIGAEQAVSAIGAEPLRAIGLAEAAPTVSEAVTFRAAAAATAMASEAVPGDTADRALVAAAAAAHPVWDLEAEEAAAVAAEAVAVGGGRSPS